jgi:hypothetical protein
MKLGKRFLGYTSILWVVWFLAKSTYICRVLECMSPRRIGTLPPSSVASEFASPPGTKGGEGHSPTGDGLGETQFRRLETKLSTLFLGYTDKRFLGYREKRFFRYTQNGFLLYTERRFLHGCVGIERRGSVYGKKEVLAWA